MSAVLNMGWVPSGDNWIRQGDYHNDTNHSLEIVKGQTEYSQNVTVVKYN